MATKISAGPSDGAEPTDRSRALFARARAVMPSGYTRDLVAAQPHPQYADTAAGCWITDVDGNRRIDWVNNFASMIHGHGHPAILETIASQAARVMNAVLPSEWEVRLAELLVERIPSVDAVRFTNTGTEANALVTKAARAFTGKTKMAKMEGGYHGQFDLLEASFQPGTEAGGDPARPVAVAHNPGTPQSLLDELVVLPLNDIANARAILRAEADKLAGVILDPWRLQGGMVRPHQDFIAMLREECTRLGILLVFDEVVSLRTSHGGEQARIGITPDLTTMGKIIGGGLPIGAVGGRRDIMAVFEMERGAGKVKHSGTFTANPLSMATGYVAMEMLTPEVFDRLERQGDRLREGLARIHRDARLPGAITGDASFTTMMFTDRPCANYRDLATAMSDGLAERLQVSQGLLRDEGLFTLRGNFIGSTAMTDDDIDWTIAAAARALPPLGRA
ncbi:aspartate aminotransferase family protein [Erythrobacter sp. NE805]|uniref:aspartate aminotransferase family protein n=1 Tax=Erythrobacter sp. NE805 TaxID=3389875 RepID=UPI00396B0DD4